MVASVGNPSSESYRDLGLTIANPAEIAEKFALYTWRAHKWRAVWLFAPREGSSRKRLLSASVPLWSLPWARDLPTHTLTGFVIFGLLPLYSRVQIQESSFQRPGLSLELSTLLSATKIQQILHLILAKRPRSDAFFAVCHTYFYGTLVLRKR